MKKRHRFFGGVLAAWIIIYASAPAAAALPLRDVGLSLFRPKDRARLEIPQGVKLSIQEKKMKPGESLEAVLSANGILGNEDAFRLVYDLNPEISDLNTGTLPASLTLPKIVGRGSAVSLLKKEGYLVRLAVDRKLKGKVVVAITGLEQQVESFLGNPESPVLQSESLRLLESTVQILSVVKRSIEQGSQPIGNSLLNQLREETELATVLLTKASAAKRRLTPEEVELLKAVGEDIIAKSPTFDEIRAPGEPPKRWREVVVRVKVVSPVAGREVPQLRVSYVPVALLGSKQYPFSRLTPHAVERLPEGNYFIWAGIDGKSGQVTPSLGPVKVRLQVDGGEQKFDLTLNR